LIQIMLYSVCVVDENHSQIDNFNLAQMHMLYMDHQLI
jgi:hypothetical protein